MRLIFRFHLILKVFLPKFFLKAFLLVFYFANFSYAEGCREGETSQETDQRLCVSYLNGIYKNSLCLCGKVQPVMIVQLRDIEDKRCDLEKKYRAKLINKQEYDEANKKIAKDLYGEGRADNIGYDEARAGKFGKYGICLAKKYDYCSSIGGVVGGQNQDKCVCGIKEIDDYTDSKQAAHGKGLTISELLSKNLEQNRTWCLKNTVKSVGDISKELLLGQRSLTCTIPGLQSIKLPSLKATPDPYYIPAGPNQPTPYKSNPDCPAFIFDFVARGYDNKYNHLKDDSECRDIGARLNSKKSISDEFLKEVNSNTDAESATRNSHVADSYLFKKFKDRFDLKQPIIGPGCFNGTSKDGVYLDSNIGPHGISVDMDAKGKVTAARINAGGQVGTVQITGDALKGVSDKLEANGLNAVSAYYGSLARLERGISRLLIDINNLEQMLGATNGKCSGVGTLKADQLELKSNRQSFNDINKCESGTKSKAPSSEEVKKFIEGIKQVHSKIKTLEAEEASNHKIAYSTSAYHDGKNRDPIIARIQDEHKAKSGQAHSEIEKRRTLFPILANNSYLYKNGDPNASTQSYEKVFNQQLCDSHHNLMEDIKKMNYAVHCLKNKCSNFSARDLQNALVLAPDNTSDYMDGILNGAKGAKYHVGNMMTNFDCKIKNDAAYNHTVNTLYKPLGLAVTGLVVGALMPATAVGFVADIGVGAILTVVDTKTSSACNGLRAYQRGLSEASIICSEELSLDQGVGGNANSQSCAEALVENLIPEILIPVGGTILKQSADLLIKTGSLKRKYRQFSETVEAGSSERKLRSGDAGEIRVRKTKDGQLLYGTFEKGQNIKWREMGVEDFRRLVEDKNLKMPTLHLDEFKAQAKTKQSNTKIEVHSDYAAQGNLHTEPVPRVDGKVEVYHQSSARYALQKQGKVLISYEIDQGSKKAYRMAELRADSDGFYFVKQNDGTKVYVNELVDSGQLDHLPVDKLRQKRSEQMLAHEKSKFAQEQRLAQEEAKKQAQRVDLEERSRAYDPHGRYNAAEAASQRNPNLGLTDAQFEQRVEKGAYKQSLLDKDGRTIPISREVKLKAYFNSLEKDLKNQGFHLNNQELQQAVLERAVQEGVLDGNLKYHASASKLLDEKLLSLHQGNTGGLNKPSHIAEDVSPLEKVQLAKEESELPIDRRLAEETQIVTDKVMDVVDDFKTRPVEITMKGRLGLGGFASAFDAYTQAVEGGRKFIVDPSTIKWSSKVTKMEDIPANAVLKLENASLADANTHAKYLNTVVSEFDLLDELVGIEGIPRVFMRGQIIKDGKPYNFMLMEKFSGKNMDQAIPKDMGSLLENFIDISDTLSQLHKKNILHLDVKPENIMITDSGSKLIDFGISVKTKDGVHVQDLKASSHSNGYNFFRMSENKTEWIRSSENDVYSLAASMYKKLYGHNHVPSEVINFGIIHYNHPPSYKDVIKNPEKYPLLSDMNQQAYTELTKLLDDVLIRPEGTLMTELPRYAPIPSAEDFSKKLERIKALNHNVKIEPAWKKFINKIKK